MYKRHNSSRIQKLCQHFSHSLSLCFITIWSKVVGLRGWLEISVILHSVPQGTKVGPILFLIVVNDLRPPNCKHWKYVDDITISEVIPRHGESTIQSELDHISSWATANYMKLNPKKCKELIVCFLRDPPSLSQLAIDGTPVEVVERHKVIGVQIQNDLKWSQPYRLHHQERR